MALSSKALQQKRAKKAEKRKQAKKSVKPNKTPRPSLPPEWMDADAPIADVYVPEGLFEVGLGSVWFSRRLEDGRHAMSAFLVDTFCLGVKNAFYSILGEEQYQQELERFLRDSEEKFVPCEPEYARKLVELAIEYALSLGFAPHDDYAVAKMIFGDVDASRSDAVFSFGRDGLPMYVPGPGEGPAMQRRIMKQLEKLNKDPLGLLVSDL